MESTRDIFERWGFENTRKFTRRARPHKNSAYCKHPQPSEVMDAPLSANPGSCILEEERSEFPQLLARVLLEVEEAERSNIGRHLDAFAGVRWKAPAEEALQRYITHPSGKSYDQVIEERIRAGVKMRSEELLEHFRKRYMSRPDADTQLCLVTGGNTWVKRDLRLAETLFGRVADGVVMVPRGSVSYVSSRWGMTAYVTLSQYADVMEELSPFDDHEVLSTVSVLVKTMPLTEALASSRALKLVA